jgi:hypothetical protein
MSGILGRSQQPQPRSLLRRPIAFVLALLLVALVAAPADAATPLRVFRASYGTSGKASFTFNTDGTGVMGYALKGLRKSVSYKAVVYRGTCSNLGSAVTSLGYIKTSRTGRVSLTKAVSSTKAIAIWQANWYKVLSLKIKRSGSSRCARLNFTHVTRVRVPAQGILTSTIDMAVVRGPSGYPYCNVAMYNGALAQPREPLDWATFVYAHARKGMFLPLLTEYQKHGANRLVGMYFYLYTSNNKRHKYRIDGIETGLDKVMAKTTSAGYDKAWLQTSTGPNYTYPKLFLKATWVSTVTVTSGAAHPAAHIVKCG